MLPRHVKIFPSATDKNMLQSVINKLSDFDKITYLFISAVSADEKIFFSVRYIHNSLLHQLLLALISTNYNLELAP